MRLTGMGARNKNHVDDSHLLLQHREGFAPQNQAPYRWMYIQGNDAWKYDTIMYTNELRMGYTGVTIAVTTCHVHTQASGPVDEPGRHVDGPVYRVVDALHAALVSSIGV